MKFLLDTNVLSELRKPNPSPAVRAWFEQVPEEALYLSVLVLGELRLGIARKRRKDPVAAMHLGVWVDKLVEDYASRVLPVDVGVVEVWANISAPDPLPPIDGLLAATAIAHTLTLVTRNVRDVERTGVQILNPFE